MDLVHKTLYGAKTEVLKSLLALFKKKKKLKIIRFASEIVNTIHALTTGATAHTNWGVFEMLYIPVLPIRSAVGNQKRTESYLDFACNRSWIQIQEFQ